MTHISVSVHGCNVKVNVEGRLTSGMVGVPVTFSFDEEWDGLHKQAIFRNGEAVYSVPLMDALEATVPWEVLDCAGTLDIGAQGRNADGSIVLPTVWARVGERVYPGANGNDMTGLMATPSLYDRLLSLIENPPVRGVDYWTEADRAQIISDVIAELPVYNGEVEEV